jgi:hypothetical protein
MWFVIFKNIIISILLIYCMHTLWNYILQICTTRKKKDLVKFQADKYASILNTIIHPQTETQSQSTNITSNLSDYDSFGMTSEEMQNYLLSAINENGKDDVVVANIENDNNITITATPMQNPMPLIETEIT